MTFWLGFIAGYFACPLSCVLLAWISIAASNIYFAWKNLERETDDNT